MTARDFQRPPSPHATRLSQGEPCLGSPPEPDAGVRFFAGVRNGLLATAVAAGFIVYCVVQWFAP